jgi:hypothetical protein
MLQQKANVHCILATRSPEMLIGEYQIVNISQQYRTRIAPQGLTRPWASPKLTIN